MSSGFETLAVDRRMLLLKGDPQLQAMFKDRKVVINKNFAPLEPPELYLVWSLADSADTNTMNGYRAFARPSLYVEASGREIGYDRLGPLMERVDELLTALDASTQVGGVWVSRFVRTNIVDRSDRVDRVQWNYLGGMYDTVAFSYP